MLNERQMKIKLSLIHGIELKKGFIPEEKEIINKIKKLSEIFETPLTEREEEEIKKDILSNYYVQMDVGIRLVEEKPTPWYFSAKANIKNFFWDRYLTYLLDEGFSPNVINTLDKVSDELMDSLGNPNSSLDFARRGLVIGDVQSGKTSTYLALINKAADAGYKVIIILTGTIERLRKQTQERVDLGFIGLDSESSFDKEIKKIGVGKIEPGVSSWAFTSTQADFNSNIAKARGSLNKITVPVVFVVKKNKTVLERLNKWLNQNVEHNQKIPSPLLLIDDEADNASINTNKQDKDPTKINQCIRILLNMFAKSNYVGFTATPYANIFIDPDTDDDMIGADLFPKNFIYVLKAPSNYIGAQGIFKGIGTEEDDEPIEYGQYHYMLHDNSDCEEFLPLKHKNNEYAVGLPLSLKEAINSFFISNVIRDLRGDNLSHRTMMVNVSRFISVQEDFKEQVEFYVREYLRTVFNYCNLNEEEALKYDKIKELKDTYEKYYEKLSQSIRQEEKVFSWTEIQKSLYASLSPIQVRSVNGKNASQTINYDENKQTGLRIIVIGGYSLSRGLTLEGLMISYYYRNSKMYDTLMQMGRWFGYRPHYADLCQVWMPKESAEWYAYISASSEELKNEIQKMKDANKTPIDFGLKVRSDKNSLLVTALNKMRTAETYQKVISLSGDVVETKYISYNPYINKKNYNAVSRFLYYLLSHGYSLWNNPEKAYNNVNQIKNVKYTEILRLFDEITIENLNFDFDLTVLENCIEQHHTDGILTNWDILIASGDGKEISICDQVKTNSVQRSYKYREDKNIVQISGDSAHIGSRTYYKAGLTQNEYERIRERAIQNRPTQQDKKALNQQEYFNSGIKRNPLLVIIPVELKNNKNGNKNQNLYQLEEPMIGFSIGIPLVKGETIKASYKINKVLIKDLLDVSNDDDFIEETGQEDEE